MTTKNEQDPGKLDSPTGPLAGVRVVDLTAIYSGPYAATILGDQGADVIKVESAGGDFMRMAGTARNKLSGSFAMLNRNKRSLVIDIKTPQGKEALLKLTDQADVVMENFRPGVMERLGLDYETLSQRNPRLVMASINGVGATGPYASRRIYDAVIQAVSGMAAVQASATGEPQMFNTLICDKITSLTASQNIVAALFARERNGVGQRVEISMLDASLFFLWPDGMGNFTFVGEDFKPAPFLDHSVFVRTTEDGYVAFMPVQAPEWQGAFRALNLPNLFEDVRFDTMGKRMSNRDELRAITDTAFLSFTTEAICQRLEAEDVPYSHINQRDQVIDDPQVQAMGALIEFEHPQGGTMRQPRPPGQFSKTQANLHRTSPGFDEHTDQIMAELGYTLAEIDALRAAKVLPPREQS